jgi:hypothetical protein
MKNIDEMSDAERMDGFLEAWGKYRRSGLEVTQDKLDSFTATWKIAPQKLQQRTLAVSSTPLRGQKRKREFDPNGGSGF